MDRKEFLTTLGLGAAFALTSTCLGGCSKDSNIELGPVDFSLDLNNPSNAALLNNEGYIIRNKVVVAKTKEGTYAAATQLCSHEDKYEVIYSQDEWYCTAHDARFTLDGVGLNDKGKKGLTIYNTELQNSVLRVFSS